MSGLGAHATADAPLGVNHGIAGKQAQVFRAGEVTQRQPYKVVGGAVALLGDSVPSPGALPRPSHPHRRAHGHHLAPHIIISTACRQVSMPPDDAGTLTRWATCPVTLQVVPMMEWSWRRRRRGPSADRAAVAIVYIHRWRTEAGAAHHGSRLRRLSHSLATLPVRAVGFGMTGDVHVLRCTW